jgi:tryptophan synthase alpha chain
MNRIDHIFGRNRKQSITTLVFYMTAGYPDLDHTLDTIDALVEGGAEMIELGMPFSDPVADGPTIQYSSQVSLANGMTPAKLFSLADKIRHQHPKLGLIMMGSYNPVFRLGEDEFIGKAVESGFDGLIIPDLPPEASGEFRESATRSGLHVIYLTAPTTTAERAGLITAASSGFIYHVSLRGVTGARQSLPPDLKDKMAMLRSLTDKPIAVGFGISKPEHVAEISKIADGAVIGSALIKLMGEFSLSGDFITRIREFSSSLHEKAGRDIPSGGD